MNHLVSAVIITYNHPDKLINAIKSVQNQTYKNLEILVVDGANSDQNKFTVDMYSKDDTRIKYIPVEQEAINYDSQKGMQHSRNVGCKLSKGKYIAMLDDDDMWEPTKIEKQVKTFENNCNVGLVMSYSKIINGNNIFIDKTKLQPTYNDLLKGFNLSSTSAFMIQTDVLKLVGYWNENLHGMHEHDLALRIADKHYKIIVVPEPLITKQWDTVGKSSNQKGKYFRIKITELFDFWHYYGRDALHNLDTTDFCMVSIKSIALFFLYMLGYVGGSNILNSLLSMRIFVRDFYGV